MAFGLIFSACNKEDESTGQSMTASGRHISKITVVDVSDGYNRNVSSIKFNWDGDKLMHVYINSEGDLVSDASFSYNGTTLQSASIIDYESNSHDVLDFIRNGSQVAYLENSKSDRISVYYEGSNPARIVGEDADNALSLVWSDGNLGRIRSSDREVDISMTEFDSHTNPLVEVLSILFPGVSQTWHNPIRVSSDGDMVSISYEYNGEYPSVATCNFSDGKSKIYFEYTDGTGTRAPVVDKYTPKRAKGVGFELLPDFIER